MNYETYAGTPINTQFYAGTAINEPWVKDGVIETLKVRIELLEKEVERLKRRIRQ